MTPCDAYTVQLYCTCKHFNLLSRLEVDTGKFLFRARISLYRALGLRDLGTRLEKDRHLRC